MTSDDIQSVQIIATCKDGQHIMAVSDDKILIRCIAEWCQFIRLKEELFEQCSLKELIADDDARPGGRIHQQHRAGHEGAIQKGGLNHEQETTQP